MLVFGSHSANRKPNHYFKNISVPVSPIMGEGQCPPGTQWPGHHDIDHSLPFILSLRMHGPIPSLPLCATMAAFNTVIQSKVKKCCCRLLTGKQIKSIDDAWEAVEHFHKKGCHTVVLSSTDLGDDQHLLALASNRTGKFS
jgi:hypothetical protein